MKLSKPEMQSLFSAFALVELSFCMPYKVALKKSRFEKVSKFERSSPMAPMSSFTAMVT